MVLGHYTQNYDHPAPGLGAIHRRADRLGLRMNVGPGHTEVAVAGKVAERVRVHVRGPARQASVTNVYSEGAESSPAEPERFCRPEAAIDQQSTEIAQKKRIFRFDRLLSAQSSDGL